MGIALRGFLAATLRFFGVVVAVVESCLACFTLMLSSPSVSLAVFLAEEVRFYNPQC